ncbi:MAG: 2OG-Fe(II) oxygenase family protein, partial [bacterium]
LHYLENDRTPSSSDVNMGAHTDYECFTILHSQTPSLQVLDLDSNWVDAPPIDNTFYFNIGDMMEAWSGGLLVATPHRVVNQGEERFSVPFFAATNYDTIVAPVDCPKFRNKQKQYEPVLGGEHLLSQLLRDFPYLRRRYEAGLLEFPDVQPGPNPFEDRMRHFL